MSWLARSRSRQTSGGSTKPEVWRLRLRASQDMPLALFLFQRLDLDVPKRHRIVVPREAEMSARAILAGMRLVLHQLGHLADVGVDDPAAVQLDDDGRAADGDFHEVPLTGRAQVAA